MTFVDWLLDAKTLLGLVLLLLRVPISVHFLRSQGGPKNRQDSVFAVFEKGRWGHIVYRSLLFAGVDLLVLSGAEEDLIVTFVVLCAYLFATSFCWGVVAFAMHLKKKAEDAQQEAIRSEGGFEASTIYQDFGAPMIRPISIFAAQTVLIVYYFEGIREEFEYDDATVRRYYASAIPLQLMAASQMGDMFFKDLPLWSYLLRNEHRGLRRANKKIEFAYPELAERALRCFLSFISNCVYFMFLIFTMPLLLAKSETPMDFVLNAFATLFITTLDDLGDPRGILLSTGETEQKLDQTKDWTERSQV